MGAKPSFTTLQQLLDLVVGYPVVLLIVEDRNQHIEVGEQILQPNSTCDGQCDIGRRSPFRELVVKLRALHFYGVAQRLEETPDQIFTATGRDDRQMGSQRNRRLRKFRSIFAPPAHCRAEYPAHRDAQERVRSIRTVIHVLLQLSAFTGRPTTAHERYRVDLDQQSRGAEVDRSIGIEHIGLPKRKLFRLEACWILVQQIAEIGCRLMRGGDREEH